MPDATAWTRKPATDSGERAPGALGGKIKKISRAAAISEASQ